MKNSVSIFCGAVVLFCSMAFGFTNWNKSEINANKVSCNKAKLNLFYNVDSRFIATISKEDLHNAKSIIDIFPKKATSSVVSYQSSSVAIHNNFKDEKEEISESEMLNDTQLKLLKSTDYSTDIVVRTNCTLMDKFYGNIENHHIVYYITIVPENEAKYNDGYHALINYLKEKTRDDVDVITESNLQPGRVNFTITKTGEVANVELGSTCGYTTVDKSLVELIENMCDKWQPASNSKGENVDQDLVFFFGKAGC